MSEAVVYEQLDQAGAPLGAAPSDADLRRLSDVPMEASVEIGRTTMTVGETLQLHPGAIVVLERLAGEPADLLVNGTLIARGEVVVVDEQFGLRISEIVEDDLDGSAALGGAAVTLDGAAARKPAGGSPASDAPPSPPEGSTGAQEGDPVAGDVLAESETQQSAAGAPDEDTGVTSEADQEQEER